MASGSRDDDEDNNDDNDHDNDDGGGGNGESGERQWCVGMESHTPKRESRSSAEALACSPMGDTMLYPWNWSEEARNVNLSPGSSCSSPEYREHGAAGGRADSRSRSAGAEAHRRGRPRADALTNLMMQGSTSPSSIKCSYCSRVFPREKSLQAHLRTHTGERPYPCDYPGCTKAFTQSGQLKTHQRLHTGEKPFLCTEPGCEMRFTHSNRHCPDHPYATLTRSDDFVLKPVSENTELPHDVTRWLERYKMAREPREDRREDRTPTGKNERKKWKSTIENHKRVKSRKGLMMDTAGEQENLDRKPPNQRLYCGESSQDSQDESQDEDIVGTCAILQTSEDEEALTTKSTIAPRRIPLDRLQPKKRWLREACLEQQLAKPLNWDVKSELTSVCKTEKNLTPPLAESTESSELQLDDYALSTHELTISNAQSSYEVCWDMNLNKESPKVTVIGEQENAYEVAHALSLQSEWDSSRYTSSNLQNLETSNMERSAAGVQSCELTRLHWDSPPVNATSTAMPVSNIEQYVRKETSQDAPTNSARINENETRPTVLMLAGSSNNAGGKEIGASKLTAMESEGAETKVIKQEDDTMKLPIQEDNKKWLGALALMELAKTQEESVRVVSITTTAPELNYSHL